jgi:hypothetical protein
MVPLELAEWVQWYFSARGTLDPTRLVYRAKADVSRCDTWFEALKLHPMGEKINPWRKCHTEHYWSYYFVGYDKATELQELQATAEAGTIQLRDLTPEEIALHKKIGL